MPSIDRGPEYNHAANDSPRSGSSKKVMPVVWASLVVVLIALAVCFAVTPV